MSGALEAPGPVAPEEAETAELAPDALLGQDAQFATRIVFGPIDGDGRFTLELSHEGEVIAFAMMDAVLAERLSAEAAHMARRCYAAVRATSPERRRPSGTGG